MFLYGSSGPSVMGGKIDRNTGQVVSMSMPTNPSTGVIGFQSGSRGFLVSLAIDRLGRFLYTAEVQTFFANRPLGDNAIGAFTIDRNSGILSNVAGSPYVLSERPEDIAIDGSGHFVYVSLREAGTIEIWSVNQSSGALTHIGSSTGGGAKLAMTWDGRFLLSNANEAVTSYSIDQASGELTPVSTAPVGRTSGFSLSIGNKHAYSWTGNTATVLSLDSDGELAVQKSGVVLQGGAEVRYISVAADNQTAYVTIDSVFVRYDEIGDDQPRIFGTSVSHTEVDFNSEFVYAANGAGDPLVTYVFKSDGAFVASPVAIGPVANVQFFRLSP
jgi:6-phosphogluconolactonase (cycloisomerase 2 family)